jgi:ribonuclease PH
MGIDLEKKGFAEMTRTDGRGNLDLRPINITRNFLKHPEGSVLIEIGDTKVICTATIEEKLPSWKKDATGGWITAEYSLLPRSTHYRTQREAVKGKLSGRTSEIMRLIGRALRAVTDLTAIGERTIIIDCDVIQADGGTRSASVTGSFVALVDAMSYLKDKGIITARPIRSYLAGISCGIVNGREMLDLTYEEDSKAQVDFNVVMTSTGEIVEVQGTAEGNPFQRSQLYKLIDIAEKGIKELTDYQKEILEDTKGIVWPDLIRQ